MLTIIVTLNKDGKPLVRPTLISKGFLFAKDNEDVFTSLELFTIDYFNNEPILEKDFVDERKEKFKVDLAKYIKDICKQNPSLFIIVNKTEMEKDEIHPTKSEMKKDKGFE